MDHADFERERDLIRNFGRPLAFGLLVILVSVFYIVQYRLKDSHFAGLNLRSPTAIEFSRFIDGPFGLCENSADLPTSCLCAPIPNVTLWRALLNHCGLNRTIELAIWSVESRITEMKVIDTEFMSKFYRPLKTAHISSISSLPQTGNHFERVSKSDADAGRCWLQDDGFTFRCLPSILIIGFQRAATREIYEWLSRRPDANGMRPSFERNDQGNGDASVETHYFDSLYESEEFHDLQPLRRKDFIGTLDETWFNVYLQESPALNLQQVLQGNFVIDKTPAYADETNPGVIRLLLPNVKMITILRHPGERLYSAYWRRCFALKSLNCSVEEFFDVFISPGERCGLTDNPILSEEGLSNTKLRCTSVFRSGYELRAVLVGNYHVFLERYRRAFYNTSAKIILTFSETFVANPFKVMTEMERGLDLSAFNYSAVAKLKSKTGMYVVSEKSKALRSRPPGYVAYSQLSSELQGRMLRFYAPAIGELKRYLELHRHNPFFTLLHPTTEINWLQ